MRSKVFSLPVVCLLLVQCVCLFGGDARAQVKIDSATFGAMEARSIGPAKMSGRISAIDGVQSSPDTIYVGAAGGGVWKSTNGGTTFKPVFDKYTQSIGAIAVDQSHPDTVWVGTGEPWVRNSVSVGTGLYKTTDGGDNWQFVGLGDSEHIGRIAVDPKNSDVVYVAALGHLWNANEERGLYKTTDGGKTWNRVLYVDKDTGCSDVVLDPQEPSIVYASTWQFRRLGWSFSSGGPGSALYRSTDAGKTWKKLTEGLPTGTLGRIAIGVAPSRTSVVYANVESNKTALYRSDDMGASWTPVSSAADVTARPFYFSAITIDPVDYNRVYKPGFSLSVSRDGGRSFSPSTGAYHGDVHCVWVNPKNPAVVYIGTDGGVYKSNDFAGRFQMLRNLPVSQFYHVSFDMDQPYHLYGGLQDNGSWRGPSRGFNGIRNSDWTNVGIGDGFCTYADPSDNNWVYAEYQGGKLSRYNIRTGERQAVAPLPRTGEARFRFNWNTPVALSPTTPGVLYIGAQFLFRSKDRGASWERISGDLTTNDPKKLAQEDSGGLTTDNSAAENHCTIYTISESPRDANVVWVGTDDGNVQVTVDGGRSWSNVASNIPGLPANTWCSSIEASRFDRATAYATFDGHTTGDGKTYVYETTDLGKTWVSLGSNDLSGYAHVVREDRVRKDLLFLGTEFGLFVTLDGGKQWAQFKSNLPPVAVRDIAIHPRESDVLLATHGRGVYIIDDITPLRSLTQEMLESDVAILDSKPTEVRFGAQIQDFPGDDEFVGANRPDVAFVTYYLKDRHVRGDFSIQILDDQGRVITTLPAGKRRGINRVEWPMRYRAPKVPSGAQVEAGSLFGPVVPEGVYTVKLIKDGKEYTGKITLVGDPTLSHSAKDRALQEQTVRKLYDMLEDLAFVAEVTSDMQQQANRYAAELKGDDPLAADLKAYAGRLEAFYKTLAATREGRITGEEQLREQIGGLYGDVSGYAGRPTQSQLERLSALASAVEDVRRTFDALTTREVLHLNDELTYKGTRQLKPMTREEYEKKQPKN